MIKTLLYLSRPMRYGFHKISYQLHAGHRSISSLKDRYKGQAMLVVGNGPSLNKTPLDDFCAIPSIGMNKISILFSRVKWRPSLIVCVNNMVIKQYWSSFAESQIPVFVSWKGRKYIPKKERASLQYFLSLWARNFSYNLEQGAGSSDTVTFSALQFAYYMGADPIILVGVDHSFSYTGKPSQYAKAKGPDVNHFDPNYFKSGSWWGVPNLKGSEFDYQNAKEAIETNGRKVFDATIGGKLNVFKKITIEEAKQLCGVSATTYELTTNMGHDKS